MFVGGSIGICEPHEGVPDFSQAATPKIEKSLPTLVRLFLRQFIKIHVFSINRLTFLIKRLTLSKTCR